MRDWHLIPIHELTEDGRQVYAQHGTTHETAGPEVGKVVMLDVTEYDALRAENERLRTANDLLRKPRLAELRSVGSELCQCAQDNLNLHEENERLRGALELIKKHTSCEPGGSE